MPLALVRETVRAYTTTPSPIDQQAAQTLLEERLADALRQSLGEGEVITTHYTAAIQDNMLTVTLQAECKEEIGKFVPFTGEP